MDLNKELDEEVLETATPEEDWSIPQEVFSNLVKVPTILEPQPMTVTGYKPKHVSGQGAGVNAQTGTECNKVKPSLTSDSSLKM